MLAPFFQIRQSQRVACGEEKRCSLRTASPSNLLPEASLSDPLMPMTAGGALLCLLFECDWKTSWSPRVNYDGNNDDPPAALLLGSAPCFCLVLPPPLLLFAVTGPCCLWEHFKIKPPWRESFITGNTVVSDLADCCIASCTMTNHLDIISHKLLAREHQLRRGRQWGHGAVSCPLLAG